LDINSDGLTQGNLRVTGNGLFEGILSVIDTITTNNFIVNGISTFFGDVNFQGRPTFNSDSAGFAKVKTGDRFVKVKFDKEYESEPAIAANIYVPDMTSDLFAQYVVSKICDKTDLEDDCQAKVEEKAFDNSRYLITKKSTKGFTILLSKDASIDATFSWSAISVKSAKTFDQSRKVTSSIAN
jgi:hypothetical protein